MICLWRFILQEGPTGLLRLLAPLRAGPWQPARRLQRKVRGSKGNISKKQQQNHARPFHCGTRCLLAEKHKETGCYWWDWGHRVSPEPRGRRSFALVLGELRAGDFPPGAAVSQPGRFSRVAFHLDRVSCSSQPID